MRTQVTSNENLINPEHLKRIRKAKKLLKGIDATFAIFYDNKGFYYYNNGNIEKKLIEKFKQFSVKDKDNV